MIRENIIDILSQLPAGVELAAAAKTRQPPEILEAVDAGIKIIGENYVHEAEKAYEVVGNKVKWHFIGHLQRNKVKKAVAIFDMIETVDSVQLAREIDRHCSLINKTMPVLIEINSGREKQKSGVLPEDTAGLVREIAALENIRLEGLMTMGPRSGDPENSRPFFAITRSIFDQIKGLNIAGVHMKYLSMGMTNSYKIAVEEGANIVRIGSMIFGDRLA